MMKTFKIYLLFCRSTVEDILYLTYYASVTAAALCASNFLQRFKCASYNGLFPVVIKSLECYFLF